MSDQYIGEIRYFPYLRGAPSGWLACDGSLQNISQYDMLYAVIGTTYGGDGSTQFALPDLRGRVPIGVGGSYPIGRLVGTETVTLNTQQLPAHDHYVEASTNAGKTDDPAGMVYAAGPPDVAFYDTPGTATPITMGSGMVGATGQGLPHDNCAPTLPIVACIAWNGVYPSPND